VTLKPQFALRFATWGVIAAMDMVARALLLCHGIRRFDGKSLQFKYGDAELILGQVMI
jgi:hypothetical protein